MIEYKIFISAVIILFLVYKLLKKQYDLLSATLFLAPYSALNIQIIFSLTYFQILLIILFLYTLIKNIINFKHYQITVVLFYISITTIFISNYILYDELIKYNDYRIVGRYFSQIINFVLIFSLCYSSYNYIKQNGVLYYFKFIIQGIFLLSILAWLQYFIYQVFSIDIFPIYFIDGEYISGIEQSLSLFRPSSLAHEPKSLSIFMAIGFFILYIFNINKLEITRYDNLLKYLFLSTIFITLSTSGIVVFFLLFILVNLFYFNKLINYRSIIILTIVILIYMFNYEFINEIIYLRVLSRDIAAEDFDAIVMYFLNDNLFYLFFGTGLGNVHYLANEYITNEYSHYMQNIIFSAKSGYLKIISEIGFIGLLLIIYIVINSYLKLNYQNSLEKSLKILLVTTFLIFLLRSYAFDYFIILTTLSINYIFIKEKYAN